MLSRFCLLVVLPVWTACYSYVPAELSTVPAGTPVRARITTDQVERVQPLIGREQRVLDGVLVAASADSVLLEVPAAARAASGGGVHVLHQRLSLPRGGITEVELRRLNRTRTTVVIAGGTAVLGYIMLDALNIGPGREGPRRGDGGVDMRIPLLMLRH